MSKLRKSHHRHGHGHQQEGHHHKHHHKEEKDVDLQSWSEIPSIAHFCSLFRQAFDLLEFDIQELEESLLLMGTPDDNSQLVLRLLIKLLKGCSKTFTNNINEDNYNTYLRRLFLSKREEAEEDNFEFGNVNTFECKALLDHDIDFPDLSLRNRVRILQQLTEYRLDAEDVFEKVKNLEANSLRVDPLGKDSENMTYWYFYGTRLYKEEGRVDKKFKKDKDKKKKKKDKKKKKKKKNRRESTTTEDDEEDTPKPKWSVACLTLKDWEELAEKYKKSKKRCDRELYETIHDNFLPEIVKMFAEQEREERRKLLAMQPKRTSSRIERKRRDQEHRDRLLAQKLEEERRLEEEYDEKVREERMKREEEERAKDREERIKNRDMMKELRAKRAAEREVTSRKLSVVEREESPVNDVENGKRKKRDKFDDLYNPFSGDNDHESDEGYAPSGEGIVQAANAKENNSKSMHFTNALLKVGSKSFKDVTLDKPVRKSAGLLLETAGQSLLQRRSVGGLAGDNERKFNSLLKTDPEQAKPPSSGLSFGLVPEKVSFGLYDGNLAVEKDTVVKEEEDGKATNGSEQLPGGTASNNSSTKRVFSNWGGEFFKKNLDYRANTNKILEKMNLNPTSSISNTSNGDGFKNMFGSSPTKRTFEVMSKLSSNAPSSGGSSSGSEMSSPTAKKFKSGFFRNS